MVPEPVFRIPGVLILIWDPLFCFEATPDPCQSVVYKIALVTEMHVCYGEAKHTFFIYLDLHQESLNPDPSTPKP